MVEFEEDLAEICGIHTGDGYMRLREDNKGEVHISGSVEEKDYHDNHVIPLINKLFNLDLEGRYFSRGTYGFVCYKKVLRDALVSKGFPFGKKTLTVQVPSFILTSGNKVLFCRFLRGLFDTDGSLQFRRSYKNMDEFRNKNNHYPVLKIVTSSRFLVEGVIKMLHDLDINFYYYTAPPRKQNEHKRFLKTVSGTNELSKWMSLIGMKNNVQFSRYLVWKKFGFCPTKLSLSQREDIINGKLDPYLLGS